MGTSGLHLDLSVRQVVGSGLVLFAPSISNSSPEPALYATCRLYLDADSGPDVFLQPGDYWPITEDTNLLWNECRISFHVARYSWSVPTQHPILEGEQYPLPSLQAKVKADSRGMLVPCEYRIGWELRAPKAIPKLQGLKLSVDQAGVRIEGRIYTLTRP